MPKEKSDGDLRMKIRELQEENPAITQAALGAAIVASQSKISRLLRTTSIEIHRDFLARDFDLIDFPFYVSDLKRNRFKFVNPAFAQFMNRKISELTSESFAVDALYSDPLERMRWADELKRTEPKTPLAFLSKMLIPKDESQTDYEERVIIDTAIRVDDGGDLIAIGTAAIAHQGPQWLQNDERIKSLMMLLEELPLGVHEVNAEGRIIFMNRYERDLLGVSQPWITSHPPVATLSPLTDAAIMNRVRTKITQNHGLAIQEPRLFRRQPDRSRPKSITEPGMAQESPDSDQPSRPDPLIGVNITDFAIREARPYESKRRSNSGLFTTVVRSNIPKQLKEYLTTYGPLNPALSEVGISTMIVVDPQFLSELSEIDSRYAKITPEYDSEPCFVYANQSFMNDFNDIFGSQERTLGSCEYLLGKSQRTLWDMTDAAQTTQQLGSLYAAVDREVMATGVPDERIESHPSREGKTALVHVLKVPHYLKRRKENGETTREPIGVEAYFWQTGSQEGKEGNTAERLLDALAPRRPNAILQQMPLPVWTKDTQLRFTYVNEAFLAGMKHSALIKERGKPWEIRTFIGRTERELFESRDPRLNEETDRHLITGLKLQEISTIKLAGKTYQVIKKPLVDSNGSTIGVLGVANEVIHDAFDSGE